MGTEGSRLAYKEAISNIGNKLGEPKLLGLSRRKESRVDRGTKNRTWISLEGERRNKD